MSDAGMKCPYCGKSAQVADHVKNGVEAARKRIAKMLDAYSGTTTAHAKGDALEAKAIARLVRAADNRDAAGVEYVSLCSAHRVADPNCHMCTPTAVPAGEAVAYLDIGVGGYLDLGTEKDDDELFKLPLGRHMLGIIGTHGVDGYKAQPAEVREVAWRHPDEVPEVVPGGNAYFWVAVRRKHDGRVYSFPAQYLNAMLLCNEWSDDTERSGNRYHHGPTCEVEGSFPATGWHDAKEHGEYDCVYQPLLGDADDQGHEPGGEQRARQRRGQQAEQQELDHPHIGQQE